MRWKCATTVWRRCACLQAFGTAVTILALWPDTHSPSHDPKYLMIGVLPLLLGIPWCIYRWKNPSAHFRIAIPFGFLFAFLAIGLVAAIASGHQAYSLATYAQFLALGLICMLVAQCCRTPGQAWRILLWIGGAVALSSLYGLAQKAGWDPFPWATRDVEEYRGLPATYGNPNVATHTLNLGLLILLGLSMRSSMRWCLLLIVPVAAHLVFTEVRAARVAIPAGIAVAGLGYVVYRYTRKPLRSLWYVGFACALIGVCAGGGTMILSKAWTGSWLPTGHTFLLRYNAYFGASEMILDRPLLGFGPGTYWIENPPYWTPYEQSFFATNGGYNAHVHNAFLESGVTTGLGGAVAYTGFLVSLIVLSLGAAFVSDDKDTKRLGYVLAACFTAFTIDGFFGFNLRSPASGLVLFVLAGILVGVATPATAATRRPFLRRLALPVMCSALGCMLAAMAVTVFAAQVIHQKATAATTLGYPDQALIFLRQAERLTPWDARIVRDEAAIYASQGRTRDAISAYERSLALNPYWVMDDIALARQYFKLGDVGEANYLDNVERYADRALELCPMLPGAHDILGRLFIAEVLRNRRDDSPLTATQLDDLHNGLDHFRAALQYGIADRGQIHRMMAQAYVMAANTDEAERAYTRAAESSPGSDMTWSLFEGFAQKTGRWKRYVDALTNALTRIEDPDPDACAKRSRITWWLARADETGLKDPALAGQALVAGIRNCPQDSSLWGAYVMLAGGGHDTARLKSALTYLKQSIPKDSAPPDAVASLVAYLENPERDAVKQVTGFLDAWPEYARDVPPDDRVRAFGWLIGVYGSQLATASQPPETRGELLLRLGDVAASIGAWTSSEQVLASAFSLLPNGPDTNWLLLRSHVLERLGRYPDALQVAQVAARQAPTDYRTQYAVARLLARNGKVSEALFTYRMVLTRFSLDPETRQQVEREMNAVADKESR